MTRDFFVLDEDFFLFDLLAVFNLIKFNEKSENIAEKIVSLMVFISDKIEENLNNSFAFVVSHIGNILFKNNLIEYSK